MAITFDLATKKLTDGRRPTDKLFFGGSICVAYTLQSDDITKGEKPKSTPYKDRKGEFVLADGALYEATTKTKLTVEPYGEGLFFDAVSESDELSEFGINLSFNFMGKKNGGGWGNQFLFNSPYVSDDPKIVYAYLKKPNGANLLVAVLSESDGWKMDYSPFMGGHYFYKLNLFANFDRAYGTPRKANTIRFVILPVGDFDDCLSTLAKLYGVPFLSYDKNGGRFGEKIALKLYGEADGITELYDGKETPLGFVQEYTLTNDGETKLVPTFGEKRGAAATVYAYDDLKNLYKKSMDTVKLEVVAGTDGNLCEHQCWCAAMLRFLIGYKDLLTPEEITVYENKIKDLLDRVTETDENKAIHRITILNKPYLDFPAYNVFKSRRIQEEFFGITILLDAYRYFGEEKYYEYAVNTMDSLLDNCQKPDGRLETSNGMAGEDYTTVCCAMIPIADMANFMKGKDDRRAKKYSEAANRMAEYLYNRGLNFPTEGGTDEEWQSEIAKEFEREMEDGSISCTALALVYYCANLERVEKYIQKAKEVLDVHENWVIETPLAQMHKSSLRWWETQWEGDADGPAICAGHAWTIWRAEADYWYAYLTGDPVHAQKAKNAFTTNFAKIQRDGRSYSIYNPDLINGGGFHARSEEITFCLAPKYADREDCGLTRYVWIRAYDTLLKAEKDERRTL